MKENNSNEPAEKPSIFSEFKKREGRWIAETVYQTAEGVLVGVAISPREFLPNSPNKPSLEDFPPLSGLL